MSKKDDGCKRNDDGCGEIKNAIETDVYSSSSESSSYNYSDSSLSSSSSDSSSSSSISSFSSTSSLSFSSKSSKWHKKNKKKKHHRKKKAKKLKKKYGLTKKNMYNSGRSTSSSWYSTSHKSDSSETRRKKKRKKKASKSQYSKYRSYSKRNPTMFDDIKFPKHPVTPVALDKFTLMFWLKMQHTGCDRYIRDNKKKRPKKPSKLDRKAYRKWNKDMEWIAVALQTCLLGHEGLIWIKNEKNGVKAWDILMKHFDVRTINPGAARTGDLTALIAIQLTSISRGSYGHFIQKFEKTAAYIKIEGKPL